MHYEIENWAFNPGSIEITNIAEYKETRGVFVVEVDDNNNVNARHIEDYRYRPFQRIPFEVDNIDDPKTITEMVLEKVRLEARVAEPDKPQPIIEITLRGRLGFPNSLLEHQEIRDQAKEMTGALHIRLKNHTVPIEFAVAADIDDDTGREKLERRVIEDLIQRDLRFRPVFENVAVAAVEAKRMALSDESPEKIADFIAAKTLAENAPVKE
jgi:DNA repair exonuclease SbcCD nuclease subunit